jgi:Protein of unknown function (DUF2865)
LFFDGAHGLVEMASNRKLDASPTKRYAAAVATVAIGVTLGIVAAVTHAKAAGFFESLFGGLFAPQGPAASPTTDLGSNVNGQAEEPEEAAFCVRLCDGRYYPIVSDDSHSTPVRMCSAVCPAATTRVFRGSEIASASDSSGNHYAKLGQAFAYRKSIVPGCTCNGKDPFGLVTIDIMSDPTLRAGDIVATGNGLKTFRGVKGEIHRTADFTPTPASKLPGDLRRREPTHVAEKYARPLGRAEARASTTLLSGATAMSGLATGVDRRAAAVPDAR